MHTSPFGYQIPDTNDFGSVWWAAFVTNFNHIDSHNHDGVNSSLINSNSISKIQQTLLAAGWVSDGGGNYHQDVTSPPSILEIENYNLTFYIVNTANAGAQTFPTVVRTASNIMRVSVNDNTINLLINYG